MRDRPADQPVDGDGSISPDAAGVEAVNRTGTRADHHAAHTRIGDEYVRSATEHRHRHEPGERQDRHPRFLPTAP